MGKSLSLDYRILDNVHGFVKYSSAEAKIMNELLFKRLQSIKQLSVANWIFPGSEHTRYIHSIGVMHIADRIAIQIGLDEDKRKIIRMAGLLHDIGHFPLSHVGEFPYKKKLNSYSENNFCRDVNREVKAKIDSFEIKIEKDFMKASGTGHHEHMGISLIRNSKQIRKIIEDECGEDALDIICDMITGNVERVSPEDVLLVQILHSELDADGIDYLCRDSAYSGTSFGNFEIDQLIGSMDRATADGYEILSIKPKGIAAADQYLINKFFSFSQVIFNKHIVVLEWMAQIIVAWMEEKNACFPDKDTLINEWIKNEDFKKYISFTDNFFWSSLQKIQDSEFINVLPDFIRELSRKLLNHQELKFVENSECRIISKSSEEIRKALLESAGDDLDDCNDRIAILNIRPLTKHVSEKDFKREFYKNAKLEYGGDDSTDIDEDYKNAKNKRLMEGICVADGGKSLHLLCDDPRSLMSQLYGTNLAILRKYHFTDKNFI